MKRDFLLILIIIMLSFIASCGGSSDSGEPRLNITSIDLPRGTVLGGDTVLITGSKFATGASVLFGANASPLVSFIDSTQITAEVPSSASAGFVDVTVDNGGGDTDTLVNGFEYLLAFTPTQKPIVDGNLGEWASTLSTFLVAENTASVGVNFLRKLYVGFDETNLYLAIEEDIPLGVLNNVIAWLDVNLGSGNGMTNLSGSELNNIFGNLDINISSADFIISGSNFKMDAAVGSEDHASVIDTTNNDAGARGFGTDGVLGFRTNFEWLRSTVFPGGLGMEISIPLEELFGSAGGFPDIPVTGQVMGVFVTGSAWNGAIILPEWILPEQSPTQSSPRLIDDWRSFSIFPSGEF